jgi:hypothetical protein
MINIAASHDIVKGVGEIFSHPVVVPSGHPTPFKGLELGCNLFQLSLRQSPVSGVSSQQVIPELTGSQVKENVLLILLLVNHEVGKTTGLTSRADIVETSPEPVSGKSSGHFVSPERVMIYPTPII